MVCGRMGCTGSANTHWRFPASSNPTYGRSWAAAPPQQRKIVKSLIMLLVSGRAIRLAATPAVQHRPKCLVSRQQGACVIWLLKRDWAGSGVGFQTRLRPAAFLQNGEWKPCDTPGPHLTAPHRDHDDQCHPSSSRLPPLLQPTGATPPPADCHPSSSRLGHSSSSHAPSLLFPHECHPYVRPAKLLRRQAERRQSSWEGSYLAWNVRFRRLGCIRKALSFSWRIRKKKTNDSILIRPGLKLSALV